MMHGAIDELNPEKGWGVTQGTTPSSNVKLGWGQQEGFLLGQTDIDTGGVGDFRDVVESASIRASPDASHFSRSGDSSQSHSYRNVLGRLRFIANFGAESRTDSDAGSSVSAMFYMPRIQPNVTQIVLPTTPRKSPLGSHIGEVESLVRAPNFDSEARLTPTRFGIRSKSNSSPSKLAFGNQSELEPTKGEAHAGPDLV